MSKKILVIAAHPDDEVLGCGATIAGLTGQGHEVYTLILGEGKTSRASSTKADLAKDIKGLKKEAERANGIMGVKKVFWASFPDNRFDSADLLDIVKEIENVKNRIKPEMIFTHHSGDLNIDHQLTFKAVLTSARPVIGETVKEIYSFEVPSSTEWNSYSKETAFVPTVFSDVTDTIDIKIRAMAEYKSELRDYPHPRSLRHIKELAKVNGTKVGLEYCENFVLIRSVRVDLIWR